MLPTAGVSYTPGMVRVGNEPERVMIDAGALNVSALVYGRADAPPAVVVHGWADSAWSMDCVARPLSDRFRVVSLDLRGHGHSDRGPYNVIHLIGDLRGVIEHLELHAPLLIGHSLGGQVSAQFAGLFPDIPSALVLIEGVGPPPHRLEATDPALVERQFSLRQVERVRQPVSRRTMPDIEAAADRLRTAHPMLDEARVRLLAEKNTVDVGDGSRRWRFDPLSRDWFNGHNQAMAAKRWRGITCPVLVVNGGDAYDRYWRFIGDAEDDYPEPLAGDALQDRLSHFADVRYEEIAGAGHMLPYDKPDELNAVVERFIDDRLATG